MGFLDQAVAGANALWLLALAISHSRSASRILLQATTIGFPVDDLKIDIESVFGAVSCHDLHVWQLTEDKIVATLYLT